MMKFEALPNELFYEIFDYLNDIELLRIFYSLNSRFQTLVNIRSKQFHLNFQSVSKQSLNHICRQILPRIIYRTVSIHLSDDKDTPYQITQFFSFHLPLRQWIHLRSLSFYNIHCPQTFNQILIQISPLSHLTSLKIDQIQFNMNETDQFIRVIWNLLKLTSLHISGKNFRDYCCIPELIILSKFRTLYMMDSLFTINQLIHLFECTPYLNNLSISVYQVTASDQMIFDQLLTNLLPSLTIFHLKFFGYAHGLESIVRFIPNLLEFKVETFDLMINGNKWQELISDYLLKLKIFHLQMSVLLNVEDDVKEFIDQLLSSFQSSFWRDEHQLFFRCQCNRRNRETERDYNVFLYTLPYAFETFDYMDTIYCKSTCLNPRDYWFYDRVHTLSIARSLEPQDLSEFPVRFHHVRRLTFDYQIEDIGILCPILHQLTTLGIHGLNDQHRFHLQTLLDRASQLRTLIFYEDASFDFSLQSQSVRHLLLRHQIYYTVQECAQFCRSTLLNQCEVLQIKVRTRGSVLDLLRRTPHLRVLSIKCERDEWRENRSVSLKKYDEIITWLRHHLPLEYCIQREKHGIIRLWIR